MSRPHRLPLSLLLILATLLFAGCAPSRISPPQAAQPVVAAAPPAELLEGVQALEQGNEQLATAAFDRLLQSGKELPAEYRLDYGIGLSHAGRYAEAIDSFSRYIAAMGRNGSRVPQARHERFLAERRLKQTQEAQARAQEQQEKSSRAAAVASQLNPQLEQNWLTVEAQLATGSAEITEPLTGIELVRIEGGCFQMGDLFKTGESDELPAHRVCVDDFYLSRYETTQQQWQQLMGYNPSAFPLSAEHPVESVSWQEAMQFASTLSGSRGSYRLPTEAEWEYAARSGGKKQLYSGSDEVDEVAWTEENSAGTPHPVGQKRANGLGLYDMSGNLYEWCLDRYAADYYQNSPQENPTGATAGEERVFRGGSWDSEIAYSRTANRDAYHQSEYRSNRTGFRLALPAALASK